jgi:hypothetical protein
LKERELDGLSFGYSVGEFSRGTKPNEPRRTIKTIKSVPEVPLVTFPMDELARTGTVKAADIRTVQDFEDALRDVLGFWRVAAKSIAQRGFKAADAGSSRLDRLVASLRDVRRQIWAIAQSVPRCKRLRVAAARRCRTESVRQSEAISPTKRECRETRGTQATRETTGRR